MVARVARHAHTHTHTHASVAQPGQASSNLHLVKAG